MKSKPIALYKIDGTKLNKVVQKQRKVWNQNDYILIGMAMLSVLFLAVFAYAPIYGLVLAFKAGDGYLNILNAINQAPWVGLDNFKDFLADPDFINIMQNTLGLNILQLLINFPAPIIFAILMSELMSDRFKKTVQTVTFFPHFISWVIFGGIFLSLLDFETGIVNTLLVDIGLIAKPLDILGGEQYFWGLIIITSIIKGVGWGSVIYVAAISGIPNELYEAAKIDGASRFQRIIHITIPSIAPTIVLFFILSIAGILNNGIEHLWVFQNANNIMRSEVLDTFIYKFGIPQWRYSYATAIGMLKSVISLALLISSNSILKKFTGKGIY
ncbi:ABC transporter permease subunit [Acholeplasma vituli]|uniref:ABC transporter permease subunit n=1 Tax=Paracholeplasma vituli TaxID=69473 RepID=A0ABT2PZP4_9MOLU|nr:ABC transporter permease subunit [Paracholeplasma vituli]MCU0105128.1 ABC transporter permease subunit [Paracholeplasma vituli]